MTSETADLLIAALESATIISVDNRNKLTALEMSRQGEDATRFQMCEGILETVRKHPPTLIVESQFSKLRAKLVQVQS